MISPKEQLLLLLSRLDFDPERVLLFGSAALAIRNLREIGDLDVFTDQQYYDDLLYSGEYTIESPREDDPYFLESIVDDIKINIFYDWTQREWHPDLHWHLNNPDLIEGWNILPLSIVLQWKLEQGGRIKDAIDVNLIEKYLGLELIQP